VGLKPDLCIELLRVKARLHRTRGVAERHPQHVRQRVRRISRGEQHAMTGSRGMHSGRRRDSRLSDPAFAGQQ
jgi:hypothetical protein